MISAAYDSALERCRELGVVLPTFGELTDPPQSSDPLWERLAGVDADEADPRNLFRVHWYNDSQRRGREKIPEHVVLPAALTGVEAPIIVALGDRFPMIGAHKVLAAYACLVPLLVSGAFDPVKQRAVWPSTGNYCRGGVAISRIMGCRGVAVLPEGMSRERFDWLRRWTTDPGDVIRTPGTESNVKEIYDRCRELSADPANVILNQFSDFGNHLVHYLVTGQALHTIIDSHRFLSPELRLSAFVSASGSAGTLGAGDYLKEQHGCRIVAVEAAECPTMLANGFGEHNIQGIGDKHIPLIHNVMNTDVVVAVSDRATDRLNVLFNTSVGRAYLSAHVGLSPDVIHALSSFGLSSIANVVAAIKVARSFDLGPRDAIVTVATDGAAMYSSEVNRIRKRDFAAGFGQLEAAETFERYLTNAGVENVLGLTDLDRDRIFNLGYFTWVEQQDLSLEDFEVRRDPSFWRGLRGRLSEWDELIREFNRRSKAGARWLEG